MREATQRALRCQELVEATTFPADLTAEERRKLIHTLHTLYLYLGFSSEELQALKETGLAITRVAPGSGWAGGRYPYVFSFHAETPLPNHSFPQFFWMYDKGESSYECSDGNAVV